MTTIIDCLFLLLVLFGFTCGDILFCTQRLVFLVDRTSYHAMSLSTLELAFAVKSAFSVCSFTFACFKVCLFCNMYQYFSSFYNWIFYFTNIPHFVYQSVDGQFGLFISFGYCEQCCYDIHVQVFYFFFKYFGYMYSRTATTLGHIVYFINYVSSQSADSWVSCAVWSTEHHKITNIVMWPGSLMVFENCPVSNKKTNMFLPHNNVKLP